MAGVPSGSVDRGAAADWRMRFGVLIVSKATLRMRSCLNGHLRRKQCCARLQWMTMHGPDSGIAY